MKKSIYFKLFFIAVFSIAYFTGNKLVAQEDKIDIKVKTNKLIKDGQFLWKLNYKDFKKLYADPLNIKIILNKDSDDFHFNPPSSLDQTFRTNFLEKKKGSIRITLKSSGKGYILGDLIVIRKGKMVSPEIRTSGNNVKIVLDACNNDLHIIAPGNKPRKSLFMKQNEALAFEIDNVNLLKYKYSLNHTVEAFNVDFDEYFKAVKKDSITQDQGLITQATDSICLKNIKLIHKVANEVSTKKTELASMDCINRDNLEQFIKNSWGTLSDTFGLVQLDSLTKGIEKYFIDLKSPCDTSLNKYLTFKDTTETITGLNDDYKKTLETLKKDFKDLYVILNTTKIVGLPVYVKGQNADLVRYTVKRAARATNDLFPSEPDEVSYDIEIRRGFKIDVSAGLFFTTLINKNYYLKDTAINDTTTYKQIIKDKESPFALSIGSVVNLDWRCGSYIYSGISVGVALPFTTDKISPQILAGANLLIGREHRIGITGGAVWGPHSVLKNGYEKNKSYAISDNTVPMTTVYDFKWYFGIVYNLGKTKILENK